MASYSFTSLIFIWMFFGISESVLRKIIVTRMKKNCTIIQRDDLDYEFHAQCKNTSVAAISSLPENTTELYFTQNVIHVLDQPYFVNLTFLKKLNLNYNKIRIVKSPAFEGLKNLEILKLNSNELKTLDKDVFHHCPLLKNIDFSRNYIMKLKSIATATAHLVNLDELDFFNNVVDIVEYDDLQPLSNSSLVYLNLKMCHLRNISAGAFSHLSNLKHLILSTNPLEVDELANATINISTTFESLYLRDMNLQIVPTKALEHLSHANLQILDFENNRIVKISNGDFPRLPKLLELNLKGCDVDVLDVNAFANLTSLQKLFLAFNRISAMQIAIYSIKTLVSLDLSHNVDYKKLNYVFGLGKNQFENMTSLEILRLDKIRLDVLERRALYGLVNLKELYIQASINTIEPYSFESLKNLRKLNLADNFISTITSNTFFGLGSLTYLAINRNKLLLLPKELYFNHSPNLDVLDLSENKLINIPHRDLAVLKKLELLLIQQNNIVPWQDLVIAGKNLSLKHLVLRGNNLYSITPAMLVDFDNLLDVDLSENPYNCTACGTYQLAEWINVTKVQVHNVVHTRCLTPRELEGNFILNIEQMAYCIIDTTSTVIVLSTTISVLIFIIIVCVCVCYYFRWYIRYYWFLTRAKVHRMNQIAAIDNFKYDAFISYNVNDRDWIVENLLPKLEAEEPRLNLCLHERDFEVGKEIWSNIVESIDSSRKVVLLLSKNFLASQWCTWEMNMAQFKLVDDCRDALVLIMLENIDKKDMSSSLRYLVRTRTYLEWIDNPQGRKLFWERLKFALQRANDQQNPQQQQQQTLV